MTSMDRWLQRGAIVLWSVILIVVVIKTALSPTTHCVYQNYYAVGRWVWHDEPIINPEFEYVARYHSTLFAELMGPFCSLPFATGAVAWNVLSLLLLLAAQWVLLRFLEPGAPAGERALCYLLLPLVGVASVFNGQANILLAACMALGIGWAAGGWWALSAFALAVPACIKIYPIALGLLVAAMFPRRFLAWYVVAIGCCLGAPFVLHPYDTAIDGYQRLYEFLSNRQEHYTLGFSLIGFRQWMACWFADVPPLLDHVIQLSSGWAALAALRKGRARGKSNRELLMDAYLLGVLWMMLFGPSTEEATFLQASPALGLLLASAGRLGRDRWTIALIGVCFFIVGPMETSMVGEGWHRWAIDTRIAALASMALFIWKLFDTLAPSAQEAPISGNAITRERVAA